MYFIDSNSNIISDSSLTSIITIIPNTMICSITSNSTVVGSNSIFNITFNPNAPILTNQFLQITFPTWGPFGISNFDGSASCSSVCTSLINNGI